MSYFHELLTSYDKLKKRKLVLEIQAPEVGGVQDPAPIIAQFQQLGLDDSAVQAAGAALQSAYQGVLNGTVTYAQPYKPDDKMQISWGKSNGVWTYRLGRQYTLNNPEAIHRFVSHFATPGNQQASNPMEKQAMQATKPVSMSTDIFNSYTVGPTGGPEGSLIDKFKKRFLRKFRDMGLSPDFALRYFGGNETSPGSFNRLTLLSTGVMATPDGTLVAKEISDDVKTSVAESFGEIIKTLIKDDITDDEKRDLGKRVAFTDDGDCTSLLIMAENTDPNGLKPEGLIFNSKAAGVLCSLLQTEIGPEFIESYSVAAEKSDKASHVIRSSFFEFLPMINNILDNCGKIQKIDPTACNKLKNIVKAKFSGKLESLHKSIGQIAVGPEYATDPESFEHIQAVKDVFGEKFSESFKLAMGFYKKSRKERMPTFSFVTAQQTGQGKKSDNIEVYETEGQLRRALRNSGFSDKDIEEGGMIYPIRLDDLLKRVNDPKVTNIIKKSGSLLGDNGIYNPDKLVYTMNIGYKHYMNLDHAKFGDSSINTINDVISKSTSIMDPDSKAFYDKIESICGVEEKESIQYKANLKNIQSKVTSINSLFTKMPVKALIPTAKKNKVQVAPLRNTVELIASQLGFEFTESEFRKPGSTLGRIRSVITQYLHSSKNLEEGRLKSYLSQLTANLYFENKINSKESGQAIRDYLSMTAAVPSIATDGALVTEAIDLPNKKRHIFNHNNMCRKALSEARKENGKFKFIFNGGTIHAENVENPEIKFTFRNVEGKISALASRTFMESESNKIDILESSDSMPTMSDVQNINLAIMTILENQNRLLQLIDN